MLVLSQEPVEMQRIVIGILTILKSIARVEGVNYEVSTV